MASILVTVKDSVSGAVISGASVDITIEGVATSPYTTDANGQASISGLTVGQSYPIVVSNTGYGNYSTSAMPIDDSTALSVDVILTATTVASTTVMASTDTTAATIVSTASASLADLLVQAKALSASLVSAVESNSTTGVTSAIESLQEKVVSQLETWDTECTAKYNATSDPLFRIRWGAEIILLKDGITIVDSAVVKAVDWIITKGASLVK